MTDSKAARWLPGDQHHGRVPLDAWRLVEIGADGRPRTLVHGMPAADGKRTRVLEKGRWLRAELKPASKTRRPYVSGFHVFASEAACRAYLKRFSASRRLEVVPVRVRGLVRAKRGARGKTWLAECMKLL